MRIAFIGQKNLAAKGKGVEKNIPEIAVQMAKKGHQISAYVQKGAEAKKIKNYRGIKVINVPTGGANFLAGSLYVFLASAHAFFCRYDIIHFVGKKQKRLAIVLKIFKFFKKAVATFAAPVGTIIRYSKKTNRISHWELRDKKYILTVGSLVKESGLHYLIEAFKQLEDTARTANNLKLVITGSETEDFEYVSFLRAISKGRSSIVFVGKKTGETLEQLYSHAYLFVEPCEVCTKSKALLEAMGHGLAALASDTKENMDVVGENGLSFAAKSIVDLRARLAYLLSRPDEVQANSILAKKRIKKEFSWDSAVEKTIGEYNLILEKNNGRN